MVGWVAWWEGGPAGRRMAEQRKGKGEKGGAGAESGARLCTARREARTSRSAPHGGGAVPGCSPVDEVVQLGRVRRHQVLHIHLVLLGAGEGGVQGVQRAVGKERLR